MGRKIIIVKLQIRSRVMSLAILDFISCFVIGRTVRGAYLRLPRFSTVGWGASGTRNGFRYLVSKLSLRSATHSV